MYAAFYGNLPILRLILETNVDFENVVCNEGNTALQYAEYNHHEECVSCLQQETTRRLLEIDSLNTGSSNINNTDSNG